MAKKQSPKQAFTTYLAPLPRAEVRAKPGFPRPSPLLRSQPPSASPWVLHGARQAPGGAKLRSAGSCPQASGGRCSGDRASQGRFPAQVEPAPGSPWFLSLSSRLPRPKCWGQQNAVSFQPVSKTPFRENAPVKFYFPSQSHLPRSQELRPGEIKYPIILLGTTEGRGGEGGTSQNLRLGRLSSANSAWRLGRPARPAVTSARDSGRLTARVRGPPVST